MLQNEKYIDFAEDNTVEVIAISRLQEGIDKKDRKAETYDAKDENGNPVKYLKEFAGMTVEQLLSLDSSPAGQYNKTGKIPYVGIVDPFTLQEIHSQPGGFSAGNLMDAVAEAKAKLNKEHGPSLKRSVLKKFDAAAKAIEADLKIEKGGVAKAFTDFAKLDKSIAKEPEALHVKAKALNDKLVEAATAELDKVQSLIDSGDLKGATSAVKPLISALKGTDLEARAKELLEKTKPAPAESK